MCSIHILMCFSHVSHVECIHKYLMLQLRFKHYFVYKDNNFRLQSFYKTLKFKNSNSSSKLFCSKLSNVQRTIHIVMSWIQRRAMNFSTENKTELTVTTDIAGAFSWDLRDNSSTSLSSCKILRLLEM